MTSQPARPRLTADDAPIDEAQALRLLPTRPYGAHKWGVGGLIIVAGAPGYVGAPALCAMAAGRVGAGIVSLAVPRSVVSAITALVPEATFLPLSEGDPSSAARSAAEAIAGKLEKARALVVGPGLGDDEHATALLAELFGLGASRRAGRVGFVPPTAALPSQAERKSLVGGKTPAVVDADGLNWLARQPDWWVGLTPKSLVLTPHVGEMSRLLDCETDEVIADPIVAARAAAVRWKQVVVLKYGYSVVADGDRAFVAPEAPASLASAGTGDVLAGAIGGFLAQGLSPVDAAALALFIGGRAARRVERRTGTLGLVASDLPLAMAEELAALEALKAREGGSRA